MCERSHSVIGERIGNFQIINQIGAGGMGEVFLGIHATIGTKVAIKMLQPHISANKEYVQRFFNEAIAAAKIQHAGIGKIFDVGFDPRGRAYLVMEFLDGETLAQRIRRLGRLQLAQIGDIGKQMSSVLEAVHKAGITHRDLKPDNVFLVGDSELASGERVKVLDFGIAKLSGHNMALTATAAGTMGTPAYMSPEQWKNSKNVDWRADAYSLGCLVFEMAAGRPPFVAETIGEACAKHLSEEPPRLSSLVAIPVVLDTLVASLLAKNPDQRPPSMRDIGNQFAGLASTLPPIASMPRPADAAPIPMMVPRTTQLSQPPGSTTLGAAAASMPAAAGRPKKRMVALIASGAAIVAVVAVLVTVLASQNPEPRLSAGPPEREPAAVAAPAEPKPAPPEEPKPAPPGEPAETPQAAAISANAPAPANPPAPAPAAAAPAKAALGKLSVRTNPFSAVFLGGRKLGETPFVIDLPVGTHTLTFKHDGRPTTTRTVVIKEGVASKVSFELPPAVARKPAVRPAAPRCDEVSCLLSNHEGACCAKFRKGTRH